MAGNFHVTAGKSLPLMRGHAHLAAMMGERDYNFREGDRYDTHSWLLHSFLVIFVTKHLFGQLQCCQMAKFEPFLSLDCARVEGVGAQSKERKGSNFAA